MHEHPLVPGSGAPSFVPGDIVADRYRLDRVVGEGGMGIVWAGTHLATGRAVAIKVLKQNEPDDAARLLREARVAASLQHRNIVQVFDLFQLPNTPILLMVMDLLQGESLGARIQRHGPLDLASTADILVSVASALKVAHGRGFIHRDLKPENIFLAREPDGLMSVKVLDFGLARESGDTDSGKITHTGSFLGTPHYMAPEQVYGEKHLDASVDVWALGTVLVECLSGRTLFDGDNFGQIFKKITADELRWREILPGFPEPILVLVSRMLARDRTHRPTDDEILGVLRTYRAPLDGPPPPVMNEPRTVRAIARGATERLSSPLPTAQHSNLASSVATQRATPTKWFAFGGLAAVAGVLLIAGSLWTLRARAPHPAAPLEIPEPPPPPSLVSALPPAASVAPEPIALPEPPKPAPAADSDAGASTRPAKPASAKANAKSPSPLDIRF